MMSCSSVIQETTASTFGLPWMAEEKRPPLRVLRGHQDTVRNVRYRAQNGVLASCGEEGIVKLWSTETL